jgi:hypothetical protein
VFPAFFSYGRIAMTSSRFVLCFIALAAAAAVILSCGSSSPRELQNISISPSTADAQQYPDGQVLFVVTGYFNTSPMTVTPTTATFGACYQNTPTTDVSVSSAGVAKCGSGAAGTYLIWANDPLPNVPGVSNCNAMSVCGGGCVLAAMAQLTCP